MATSRFPAVFIGAAIALTALLPMSGCDDSSASPTRASSNPPQGSDTGSISGVVHFAQLAAARSVATDTTRSAKVFLMQCAGPDTVRQIFRLKDSLEIGADGAYRFDKLPSAIYKVYGLDERLGWRSDTSTVTLRVEIQVRIVVEVNPPPKARRRGVTFGLRSRDSVRRVDYYHCTAGDAKSGTIACDPYVGEQECSAFFPVLCLVPTGLPRPNYPVPVGRPGLAMPIEYYNGWTSAKAKLTERVMGTTLTSRTSGDSLCQIHFGPSAKMAEWHDGRYIVGMSDTTFSDSTWDDSRASNGGWGFYTGSSGADVGQRFWVAINDQNSNCWNP